MRRRRLLLVLAVALPTVLLGAGWLYASLREQAALRREQRRMLTRTADAVRGAVDESLEELRRREDQRPFYLYNPMYSPPDVVSVVDPVAWSPLARDPDDPRIVGYFQVEPDGTVRTPYSVDTPDPHTSPRGALILELVSSGPFEPVRALSQVSGVDDEPTPRRERRGVAGGRDVEEVNDWLSSAPDRGSGRESARRRRRAPVRDEPPHARVEVPASADDHTAERGDATPPADEPAVERVGARPLADESPPQNPLTTKLNVWSQNVFNDIQQAQAGDVEANRRIQERGRAASIPLRNDVSWEQVEQAQQRAREVQAGAPNVDRASVEAQRGGPGNGGSARVRPRRVRRPSAGPPAAEEVDPPSPPVQQIEEEVAYTPMAWRQVNRNLVLHRVVSHQGTAVVQGVILDRDQIVNQWIPALVRRHALHGSEPRVVEGGSASGCAILRPVSEVLDDVRLCYSDDALARVPGGRLDALGGIMVPLELAALGGLVLIVTLAGFTMYRAAQRADELSRQKSAFVSAVSHELRTPLTTIRMHAEMLRDGLVTEQKRPRFHDQLVHESVRLSHLVDNVLELSRLEEGRRVLSPREGDLKAAVASVVEEQRHYLERKGFEVRAPAGDGPVHVSFDAQALSQIVVNLLDNAVKYGRGDDAVVEVSVSRDGDGACLAVRDHGPGIPPHERDKVFERFHRVETEGRAHLPGTGIGLSLVRELARAHGGEAEVRECPDGGCEVRVVLP